MRYHFLGRARDSYGNILSGIDVSIYLAGTTTAFSVWSAQTGGTSISTVPQRDTNSSGQFDFYVDDSEYSTDTLADIVVGETTYSNMIVFPGTGGGGGGQIDWQESVKDRYDPTGGLPTWENGDRYISTATANGWTVNNIYEGSPPDVWAETEPNEGYACWVEDEDLIYIYNGAAWVLLGSILAGVAYNPATADLDMNNFSITNLKDASLGFKGGGTLTRTDYLDAISKKHTQGTDLHQRDGYIMSMLLSDYKKTIETGMTVIHNVDISTVDNGRYNVIYTCDDPGDVNDMCYFEYSTNQGGTWTKVGGDIANGEGTHWARVSAVDDNNIFVVFLKTDNKVYFTKTVDGGTNWSVPTQIGTEVATALADNVDGPDIVAEDANTVYIAWYSNSDKIRCATTIDGGVNWTVVEIEGKQPDYLSIDIGSTAGTAYVVWSQHGNKTQFSKTVDTGQNWSAATDIANKECGHSDLSVVDDDTVVVAVYDDDDADLFIYRTLDGGANWAEYLVDIRVMFYGRLCVTALSSDEVYVFYNAAPSPPDIILRCIYTSSFNKWSLQYQIGTDTDLGMYNVPAVCSNVSGTTKYVHAVYINNDTDVKFTYLTTDVQLEADRIADGEPYVIVEDLEDAVTKAQTDAVNQYFVGKHGNDSNDGKSWAKAFLTFHEGLNRASSGDVVVCHDNGVYAENIGNKVGVDIWAPKATLQGVQTIAADENWCFGKIIATTGTTGITFNSVGNEAHIKCIDSFECQGDAVGSSNYAGTLILNIGHAEIETGFLTSMLFSDGSARETTIIANNISITGNGGTVIQTGPDGQVSLIADSVKEGTGGSNSVLFHSQGGPASVNAIISYLDIERLSDITANTTARLVASVLHGNLTEVGAGSVTIVSPDGTKMAAGINMDSHQVSGLSIPNAVNEAIRQTDKITEVNLEESVVKAKDSIPPQIPYLWNQTFPYLQNIGIDVSEWVYESDGEFLTDAVGNASYSVTPLLNGNWLIIYDKAGASGQLQVRGPTGAVIVAETQFSAASIGYHVNTCTLRNGNVVIVYKGDANHFSFQIRDQRGASVKGETYVGSGPTYSKDCQVTPLLWGGFLVVYRTSASGSFTIYDADGSVLVSETEFIDSSIEIGRACTLNNGNVFLCYVCNDEFVQYQIRDSLGNEVVADTNIFTSDGTLDYLNVATLVDGHVVVSSRDEGDGNGIFYIYDQNGVKVVDKTTYDNGGDVRHPVVLALPNGHFMTLYSDAGTTLNFVIYDGNGVLIQAKTLVKTSDCRYLDLAMLPSGKVLVIYDDTDNGGGKYELWEGVWYEETYDFIPIEWAEDGSVAPDAAELISSGNGSVRVRKFAAAADNQVIIPWELPDKYYMAKGIKFEVLGIITEATAPNDETINFNLAGYKIEDNESLDQVLGTEQGSDVELSDSYVQYDRFETVKSAEIDISLSTETSVLAVLILEREGATDTYNQKVGIYGVKIYYYKTK